MSLSTRDILERLVSFPTVSRDTNLPLIDWVETYVTELGVRSFRVPKEADPTKHALYCVLGPNVPGGVLLSGHTDVVPVDGQPWTSDPWKVTERDGKLYGRGTCDMKGFDALALHALQRAVKSDLKRPLYIALSYDEEVGCIGAAPMIKDIVDQGFAPAEVAIVGEPSMLACVTGHKGIESLDVHVKGFEVHSSLMHTGVSAVMESARLIEWINAQNTETIALTPTEVAGVFDPPWTTVHVGMIEGGTAHNITAKDCHFMLDFRTVPDESKAAWRDAYFEQVRAVEARMQAVHPEARIEISENFSIPGLVPEQDGEAEALVRALTGDNASHVVSYGTEAGHFQNAGYSSVICGPGNIEQGQR